MDGTAISGEIHQFDRPEWAPLVALVGEDVAEDFMWMHEVELVDGRRVHAFKHRETRRYFHLLHDGGAFAYTPGGLYEPIEPEDAIREVLDVPYLGVSADAVLRARARGQQDNVEDR